MKKMSLRLVFIGVYWCLLVFIGVYWCLLVFIIGVYQNDFQKETLFGDMSRHISKTLYKFLKLPNSKLSCKVKEKRLNTGVGYGLEIPVIYTFNGHEKSIEWIKSKIQEDVKLEQSIKNRCLK